MTTQIAKPNTALTVAKPSAINLMASRMSVEPAKLYATLKSTVFKNATDEELLALVVVSNEYDLNPLLREIFAFPSKGGGITPVVSVDGWNKMLIRQKDFDGIEFDFTDDEAGNVHSCTATVHVKNRSHPMKITEYFAECKRNTDNWNNMPRRMLRNRTLCQASRMAFGISGVQHEEEALDVEATVISAMPSAPPPKVIPATSGEAKQTPQSELEAVVVTGGFTFDHLKVWGKETGNIEGADEIPGFAELPNDVCKRLLRAQAGLLKGLEAVKAAQ